LRIAWVDHLSSQERIEAIQDFKREGKLLAKLTQQNVPFIVDLFEENGTCYLVMQLVRGETLEDLLEREVPLPLEQLLLIALQLCDALGYLHAQQPQIIFRDIKPANIMITSDKHIYLIDFGIARHYKPGQKKNTTARGSQGYAAPEQYGKGQTSVQSDLYSLAATLHHLLTADDPSGHPFQFQLPFPGFPDSGVLDAFFALLKRMLEMSDKARPGSVAIVKQELLTIQAALSLQPLPNIASGAPVINLAVIGVDQQVRAVWLQRNELPSALRAMLEAAEAEQQVSFHFLNGSSGQGIAQAEMVLFLENGSLTHSQGAMRLADETIERAKVGERVYPLPIQLVQMPRPNHRLYNYVTYTFPDPSYKQQLEAGIKLLSSRIAQAQGQGKMEDVSRWCYKKLSGSEDRTRFLRLSSGVEIHHQGGYNFLIVQGTSTKPMAIPQDLGLKDDLLMRELGLQDEPRKVFGIAIM